MVSDNGNLITVELVYADQLHCWLRQYTLPAGSTVKNLLDTTQLLEENPNLKTQTWTIGIYSKPCDMTTVLQENDRVEIYRPITCDPKQARRQRQQKHKQ